MPFDFKKLGVDRIAVNVAKTVGAGQGNVVTGDISRGEVVDVTLTAGEGEATVKARRTGAAMISADIDNVDRFPVWSISGTTLSVSTGASPAAGTITFWVF